MPDEYTTPLLIGVAVVTVIGIIILIGNTVYLNIIRKQIKNPTNSLNKNLAAANVFFAFDIIFTLVLGAIFIWSIYVLVRRSYEPDLVGSVDLSGISVDTSRTISSNVASLGSVQFV